MIGSIRGRLAAKLAPVIVVECSGIGYEIETPMSTYLELAETGTEVFLHTHLLVRDDAHMLYGFATGDEKALFRTLLKVSGVGAKMGLAILSAMTVTDFVQCVRRDDTATLVRIPGVGKKTAERLIVEMRDKFDAKDVVGGSVAPQPASGSTNPRTEAFDALVSLGYKPSEVKNLLTDITDSDTSAEDIIRQALRKVAT